MPEERILLVLSQASGPGGQEHRRGHVLDLSGAPALHNCDANSTCPELVNVDLFRHEYFRFLEQVGRTPLRDGLSLNDAFRVGGYSVWWTLVVGSRGMNCRLLKQLRQIYAFNQAVNSVRPERVLLQIDDPDVAAAMESRCRADQIQCDSIHDSAARRPSSQGWKWTSQLKTIRTVLLMPLKLVIRAVWARCVTPSLRHSRTADSQPAVVFSARNSNYARPIQSNGRFDVWFWKEIGDALRRRRPRWRQSFLQRLGARPASRWKYGGLYHSGWALQKRLDNPVPLPDRFPAIGAWFRAFPRQLSALARLGRVEKSGELTQLCRFAGADVTGILLPRLRDAVGRIAEWECGTASRVRALRSMGRVAAMVVAEEFYPSAMLDLAAARRLGIPTIGAQHGTIMPSHFSYTVPRGQLEQAPVPDYFAAYSDYAKEVVSEIGSYPAEQVWVTGSPRFDSLKKSPPDRDAARRNLEITADKRVVVVATQTYPWFPRVVEAAIRWARDHQDCLVCIKTHPKRAAVRAEEFLRLANQLCVTNVRCFDDRFDELLAACDVLVSGSSTTVLEAALLGRAAICVNFSEEPDWYPYVEDGAALPARSESELAVRLNELLDDDREQGRMTTRRSEFLLRHAGPAAEGRAAEELADRIIALVERRSPTRESRAETLSPLLCGGGD